MQDRRVHAQVVVRGPGVPAHVFGKEIDHGSQDSAERPQWPFQRATEVSGIARDQLCRGAGFVALAILSPAILWSLADLIVGGIPIDMVYNNQSNTHFPGCQPQSELFLNGGEDRRPGGVESGGQAARYAG